MKAFARAAIPVAHLIRRGPLAGAMDAAVGAANPDGDAQKALDLFADKAFEQGLRGCGVRAFVSEERDAPTIVDPEGALLVAIDPLDGSSNIDANVTIGTIFSVLDAPAGGGASAERFPAAGEPATRRGLRDLRAADLLRLHHRRGNACGDARSGRRDIPHVAVICTSARAPPNSRSTPRTRGIGPNRSAPMSTIA